MDSPAPTRMRFSTDALPAHERFPAFFEEIVRRVTGVELETDNPLGFHASLALQRVGALGVSRTVNAAVNTARTARLLGDGDDTFCIMLLEKGAARYETRDGDRREAEVGDGVVCDSGYVGSYDFTADSQSWCLKVPRKMLTQRLPGVTRLSGATLDRNVIARRLLFGYVSSSSDIDLREGERATELFQDHIVDLLALALGAEGESRELAEQHGARAARRIAVLREIERRSGDAGLSAAAVARRLGVSPRYVHLILEETGKSFTHHVLERRLERAAAILRDPRCYGRKIAEVAAAAGFADLSYFNRAFRRRYGSTPSDMRRDAAAAESIAEFKF